MRLKPELKKVIHFECSIVTITKIPNLLKFSTPL